MFITYLLYSRYHICWRPWPLVLYITSGWSQYRVPNLKRSQCKNRKSWKPCLSLACSNVFIYNHEGCNNTHAIKYKNKTSQQFWLYQWLLRQMNSSAPGPVITIVYRLYVWPPSLTKYGWLTFTTNAEAPVESGTSWPSFLMFKHYNDVIMTTMASQITSLTIVYSTVYSGADQSSASLAFVRGIHRWTVNYPHKGPVTRKMFPFDDVIMRWLTGLRQWDTISLARALQLALTTRAPTLH